MKIRNGFVSNSSSSSFLVFFPKEINNKEELYELMWNERNEKSIQSSWDFIDEKTKKDNNINKFKDFVRSYNSLNMTFDEFKDSATEHVFKDIKKQGHNNYLYALSEISGEFWIDNDGITLIDNHVIKTVDDIKFQIKELKNLESMKSNFNWDIKNADDIYEDLENEINSRYSIENISNTLNEIEQYIKKHKGMVFYTFTFSDEDGTYFSIMEHGGIFGDLPVYVESNH
jgi:hypothetical protein